MAAVVENKGRLRLIETDSRATVQASVRVQTTLAAVARRLGELTDKEIRVIQPKRIKFANRKGCSDHCPDAHVHVETEMTPTATWEIGGAGAAIVLHNLVPFMSGAETELPKSRYLRFIDEVIEAVPVEGRGRHAVDLSIARLSRLGWKIPDGLLAPVISEESVPAAA